MKKLFFSALLAVFITASSFATGSNESNAKAAHVFETEFKGAQNVKWTSNADFEKVSFTFESKEMDAFYDGEGSLIGTTSKIALQDLPISAKRRLAKKLVGYTVKEAIRFDGTDETAYYVSAENETGSLYLKVSTFGLVSIFKQIKK